MRTMFPIELYSQRFQIHGNFSTKGNGESGGSRLHPSAEHFLSSMVFVLRLLSWFSPSAHLFFLERKKIVVRFECYVFKNCPWQHSNLSLAFVIWWGERFYQLVKTTHVHNSLHFLARDPTFGADTSSPWVQSALSGTNYQLGEFSGFPGNALSLASTLFNFRAQRKRESLGGSKPKPLANWVQSWSGR